MLHKRAREDNPESHRHDHSSNAPLFKQRKPNCQKNQTKKFKIEYINDSVWSEHVLKYLENLELVRFSLISLKCRELFRNYQAGHRKFVFVHDDFDPDETRVILRDCKDVTFIHCSFDFSEFRLYESNVVTLSIFGSKQRRKADILSLLSLCKFNNLTKLVLQGFNLEPRDLAQIEKNPNIDLLKNQLRYFNLEKNYLYSTNLFSGYVNLQTKDGNSYIGMDLNEDWNEDRNITCYNALLRLRQFTNPFDLGQYFYFDEEFKDYRKAFENFSKSGQTNPKSYELLGYMYDKGRYVTKNYEKAFENYMKGAASNSGCAYNVGMAFENGHGTTPDLKKAYEYYEKAATKSNIKAIYKMAGAYGNGVAGIFKQDFKKAIEYYSLLNEFSGDFGVVQDSHIQKAYIYEHFLDDLPKAQSLLSVFSSSDLYCCFKHAMVSIKMGDIKNFNANIRALERIYDTELNEKNVVKEESEKEIVFTSTMLDVLRYIGCLQSRSKKLQVLFENVNPSTTDIIFKLGYHYETDSYFQNGSEAEMFYQECMKRGDPRALPRLGSLYMNGSIGISVDLDKAVKLCDISMQLKDQENIFNFGVEFLNAKYYLEALECFQLTHYPVSSYYISYIEGYCFEKGFNGVTKNVYSAIEKYRNGCEPNFMLPVAFYKTGKLAWAQKYDDLAYSMLRTLLTQCESNKQSPIYLHILACMYHGGYFVDKCEMEALRLLEMASKLGYKKSKKKLEKLLSILEDTSENYL